MRRQDDLARQRRLNKGCCPTHGIMLTQCGLAYNEHHEVIGVRVECPRKDCDFVKDVRRGTKLMKVLEGEVSK